MEDKTIVVGDASVGKLTPITRESVMEVIEELYKSPVKNIPKDQWGYLTPQQRMYIDKVIKQESLIPFTAPLHEDKDEYISDDERENFGAVNSNVSVKKLSSKKAKSKAAKKARKKNRRK
jgi:hypothetical protein